MTPTPPHPAPPPPHPTPPYPTPPPGPRAHCRFGVFPGTLRASMYDSSHSGRVAQLLTLMAAGQCTHAFNWGPDCSSSAAALPSPDTFTAGTTGTAFAAGGGRGGGLAELAGAANLTLTALEGRDGEVRVSHHMQGQASCVCVCV